MTCNRYVKVAAWCLALVFAAPGYSFGQAGQPAEKELTRAEVMGMGKFLGPSKCLDCHTLPKANHIEEKALDFVLLTEYSTWKTLDKHAQAFAVLHGTRGKMMEKNLGFKDVAKQQEAGCLNCHAMNYLKQEGQEFKIADGVSCGGCHGPSEHWFEPHQDIAWRMRTPAQKAAKGMVDLRNPLKRAELCLSCHVGNAAEGKVITHAMYAAGHPPLPPMEIATFAQNMPQHWRNASNVPYFQTDSDDFKKHYPLLDKSAKDRIKKNYHLETVQFQRTRSALVGAVVALRETMQLIADRANREAKEKPTILWPELSVALEGAKLGPATPQAALERWPELAMANSDCYGCHHELRSESWRQSRGYGYQLTYGQAILGTPGRPQIKPWPISTLELAIAQAARKPGSLSVSERTEVLHTLLSELVSSVNQQPFGDPAKLRDVALKIIAWANGLLVELEDSKYDENAARALLSALVDLRSLRYADYESARQCASILRVIYEDMQVADNVEIPKILDELWSILAVRPYADRGHRQDIIIGILGEFATDQVTKDGMKSFYDALQHLDKPKIQERLGENPFLRRLLLDIRDTKLTEKLQSPKVIDDLQESSDKELMESLKAINEYDPKKFYNQLQEMKKQLNLLKPPSPAVVPGK